MESVLTCHGGGGFGIFDSPGDALGLGYGQRAFIRYTIWGSGNVGHPIALRAGASLILALNPAAIPLTGGPGLSDIIINGRTSGPAVQTTNPYGYTADVPYSFANLVQTVALGGFGWRMFDPSDPATRITGG